MLRILKWFAGFLMIVVVVAAALFLATDDDYYVPSLVTHDSSLPTMTIAGHKLHVRVIQGPPDAGVIVVLHGGPGGDFRSLLGLAALSNTHTVIFYDQRGAGLSERVSVEALTLNGYLEELGLIISHFAPDDQVVLIGHSWGAMLAAAYMGVDSTKVDSAILIEPGYLDAVGQKDWEDESRQLMSGASYIGEAILTGFRAAHVEGPDEDASDDFLIGWMVKTFAGHPDNPYHCGDGYTASSWRFGALSSKLLTTMPPYEIDRIAAGAAAFQGRVLLMAGACNDWTGSLLQSKHLSNFATAQLVVVPEAGHDVTWDNPSSTVASIRSFLSETDP